MIRYRPLRQTLTASLKDEQIYDTLEAMTQDVFEHWRLIFSYIGADPLRPDQLVISSCSEDDPLIGWKNVRNVFVKNTCIGFCGE